MTTNQLTTTQQIAIALHNARLSRHQPDCTCGKYMKLWCTRAEWKYCTIIDKLIDETKKR